MKKVFIALIICTISINVAHSQSALNPMNRAKMRKSDAPTLPSGFQPSFKSGIRKIDNASKTRPVSSNASFSFKPLSPDWEGLEVVSDGQTERPAFIKGKIQKLAARTNISLQDKSFDYLDAIQPLLSIENPRAEFAIHRIDQEQEKNHIRLHQLYKGIPVYGSEVILHTENGQVALFNGRYFPTPRINDLTPNLQAAQASEVAMNDVKQKTAHYSFGEKEKKLYPQGQSQATLVIYHQGNDENAERLAWHVTTRPNLLHRWEYFVDAKTGDILNKYNHTCSLTPHKEDACIMDGPTNSNSTDLNNQSRSLNTYLFQGSYYMFDGSRSMYNNNFQDPQGAIFTLDLQNTTLQNPNYREITSSNNVWNDQVAVSAHYNGGKAYEYFKNVHNRNSINGQGGNIVSFIHVRETVGQNMDNAFWNGQFIFYGDGQQAFKPLAGSLDVAGHEMTHGVVSNTANLDYQGESGAINESMADIFGTMMDRDDWKIGEDITKTSYIATGALRDMSNPHNGGSSLNDAGYQPRVMSEKYNGSQDNGGVHINSGIVNYAYYLFATNVTKEKAEKIYYRALTTYLTRSSKFIDLRLAVVQAATDLYGTTEANAAKNAFATVGIGEGTATPPPTDAPTNPGQDFILSYDTDTNDAVTLYRSSTTGTNFVEISRTAVNRKPSVRDDGKYAYFVSADKHIREVELYDVNNNGSIDEDIISSDPVWENVAISKEGDKLAAVTTAPEAKIWVVDFNNGGSLKSFDLYNPTTSTGSTATNEVLYADALEWDYSGQYIMYDAYNEINSSTGTKIDYWDVGFLRVWNNSANTWGNGTITKLYSSLPENISVGNPTFSKNSPQIIAYDYINFSQNKYDLVAANIETGRTATVFANGQLNFPNYSKLDNKIIFDGTSSGSPVVASINIASDKITPSGTPSVLIPAASWGIWYSQGERNVNTPTEEIPELKNKLSIYPNPFNQSITVELDATKQATAHLLVTDIMGRQVKHISLELSQGINQVPLSLENLSAGTYLLQVRINNAVIGHKLVKY